MPEHMSVAVGAWLPRVAHLRYRRGRVTVPVQCVEDSSSCMIAKSKHQTPEWTTCLTHDFPYRSGQCDYSAMAPHGMNMARNGSVRHRSRNPRDAKICWQSLEPKRPAPRLGPLTVRHSSCSATDASTCVIRSDLRMVSAHWRVRYRANAERCEPRVPLSSAVWISTLSVMSSGSPGASESQSGGESVRRNYVHVARSAETAFPCAPSFYGTRAVAPATVHVIHRPKRIEGRPRPRGSFRRPSSSA